MSYRNDDIETTDIVISNSVSNFQKGDALSDYKKKTKFIKVALDMDDKKLNATKVKDLPDLMEKAKEELTVGKMNQLLQDEVIVESGFLRGIAGFFMGMKIPKLKKSRY